MNTREVQIRLPIVAERVSAAQLRTQSYGCMEIRRYVGCAQAR